MAETDGVVGAEQEIRDTIVVQRENAQSAATSVGGEIAYSDSFIGFSLLNYKVTQAIGRGAMGTVYRAQHTMLQKEAAIKLLHPHLCADEQAIKRFKQEATSASRLQHPGIVGVQDFGVTPDGRPYLLMDYVEGESLSQLISKGPIEPNHALRICSQICAALAEAHRKGVIHRDIKPSNVIVVNAGQADETIKVVDFGIAKVIAENQPAALTQTGESIGSPPYMSPEQCQARPLDARSDVYSLGCVLYEMLTGQSPFAGSSIYETIHKQITTLPDPIGKVRPEMRNAVQMDALVLTALAKDPQQRFQTVNDFKTEIDGILAGNKQNSLKGTWTVVSKRYDLKSIALTSTLVVLAAIPVYFGVQFVQQLRTVHAAPSPAAKAAAVDDSFYKAKREAEGYLQAQQYKNALEAYRTALHVGESRGDEDPDYQSCLRGLEKCLYKTGDGESARAVGRTLITLGRFRSDRTTLADVTATISRLTNEHVENPQNKTVTMDLIQALTQQAELYNNLASKEKGAQAARTAWKLAQQSHVEAQEWPIRALAASAISDVLARNYSAAAEKEQLVTNLCRASHAPFFSPQMAALNEMSGYHYFRESTDKTTHASNSERKEMQARARACYEDLIKIDRELYGRSSPYLADALYNYGVALRYIGEMNQSLALLDQSVEMNRKYRGANDVRLAHSLSGLGFTQLEIARAKNNDQYRLKQALSSLNESKDILETNKTGGGEAVLWTTYALLGDVYLRLDDAQSAERFFNLAFVNARTESVPSDTAIFAFQQLWHLYQEQNRTKEVDALMRNLSEGSKKPLKVEVDFSFNE